MLQSPINRIKNTLVQRVTIPLLGIAIVLSSVFILAPAQQASAWSGDLPTCDVKFTQWAYKDRIKELNPNINTDTPNFPAMIMFSTNSNASDESTQTLSIYFFDNTTTTQFYMAGTDKKVKGSNTSNMTNNFFLIQDTSGDAGYQPGINQMSTISSFDTSSLTCIAGHEGFWFASNWVGQKYLSGVPEQEGYICDDWDIACHVGKVFAGVADTFKAVGGAIVNGIGRLFNPDEAKMAEITENNSAFWSEKLGFLVYPFTFLVDMVSAFTEPSGDCTATSCNITFGSWYGSPFAINFYAMKENVPAFWNVVTVIARALLVLGLIFLMRHKYMEVVTK